MDTIRWTKARSVCIWSLAYY